MPNLVNEAIHAEYGELLGSDLDALFVQPVGMSVEDVNALRGKLGAEKLRMKLLKGSLARRTLAANGLSADALFEGPAAIIVEEVGAEVEATAIAASRVIADWRKSTGNELPVVKGGVMEGEVLGAAAAKGLASLPTKADMQSRLVAQILSPGANLSGQLIAGGSKIAGAIKTHIEKLEQTG